MKYICSDPRRLEIIKADEQINGIEYLEVRDHLEPDLSLRQRTLFVRLLLPDFTLQATNVSIDGGERLPVIPVEWVSAADDLPAGVDPSLVEGIDDLTRTLVVRTTAYGDFSRYTLRLRASQTSNAVPQGFDARLSHIEFSFKVECPSDFDCAHTSLCPPKARDKPIIDYLAKDYTGFRRLMLDRLNLLAPGWSERSAADVGVALVEVLAYAADNLSYRQDAIATEAYLATARNRKSVRRHARLVDYQLHEGCNARAWVQIAVKQSPTEVIIPKGTQLLTKSKSDSPYFGPDSRELQEALVAGAMTFETMHEVQLFSDLNALSFYTWGDDDCCLPRGATSATLIGEHLELKPGAVLIFQERTSPTTGIAEDADPAKRWAVRLTAVTPSIDPSGWLFGAGPPATSVDVTEIEWDTRDALPFSLCLSAKKHPNAIISIALGNIVLVDHGRTVHEELGNVTGSRFRPALSGLPLSHGWEFKDLLDPAKFDNQLLTPASELVARDPHDAIPQIELESRPLPTPDSSATTDAFWTVRRDLLGSRSADEHFVVETENDGTARLRFGDDVHGRRPNEHASISATYRLGNGSAGNVGAEAIHHIVSETSGVFEKIWNPMPARGGVDPESIEAARRDAPEAFRKQERAVTAADYAAAAERRADVQRAAATFRWTGSWHTVFVAADRFRGAAVDAQFETALRRDLERFRMAGYDLEVEAPRYAALDIALSICVLPRHIRSEVVRAVRAELGSGTLSDGRLGAFHPDNFTFGEPVYLSRIIARAQSVPGVESVSVTKFQRMAEPDPTSLANGVIPVGRLEIATLANNPNFRERGRLLIHAGGGR